MVNIKIKDPAALDAAGLVLIILELHQCGYI